MAVDILRWRQVESFSVLVASSFAFLVVFALMPSALSENVAPQFIEKPNNQTTKSGMSINFNCKASGFPSPSITWYKKGVRVHPLMPRHHIGRTFKKLYIIPVYWSDAGQITCEASNSAGTIRVHAYLRVVSRSPPKWTKAPQNVTLYKGQRITIPCSADGYPDPTYRWTREGVLAESDPSIMSRLDGGLMFTPASLSHSGFYTCTVSNQAGHISKSIYVDVVRDPTIIRHPKDAVGVVGQDLSLQCVVIGNPAIHVEWKKDGTVLDTKADALKVVMVQNWDTTAKLYTLKIKQANASDAGKYTCVAVNERDRKISKEAVVTFTGFSIPPAVRVPYPIKKVTKGSDAILKCIFTGTPLPQIIWFRHLAGRRLELKKTITAVNKESIETSLLLAGLLRTDEGIYYCQGQNKAGVATGNVTLIIPADPRKPEFVAGQSSFTGIRDHNVTLTCMFTGNPQPEVEWYKDDQEIADELGQIVPGHNNTYVAKLTILDVQYQDVGNYLCRVLNPFGKTERNVTLMVKGRPMPPHSLYIELKSRNLILVSWTPGIPGALPVSYTIEHKNNDTYSWTEIEAGYNTSKTLSNEGGWYGTLLRVRASNSYGSSKPSQAFYIKGMKNLTETKIPTSPERSVGGIPVVIGSVLGGILLLILLVLVLLVLWRKRISKRKKRGSSRPAHSVLYTRSHLEEDELLDLTSSLAYSYVPVGSGVDDALQREPSAEENQYQTVGTPANWEVPKRCLTMDKDLGAGHFGKVVKAFMKTEDGTKTVAVKMLKENADGLHKKEFLAELELMKSMKPHPNIVGLIGSCTKGDNPYIIVEYCALGNLQDLLRKSRGNRVYSNLAGGSISLTSRDLLSFMWQVARGMSYLASLKLVHRDLATRNVLVDTGNICKIADFGLARDIYEDNQYLKTTEGELPLRWMALESIFQGITTTESDVWSFGVLMWEIITLGAKPYPGFTREQLISNLHLGYRMPRPTYCKEELYAVIWQCWHKEPSERPNFSMLCRTLNRMLAAEKVLIDLDNLDAKYINANSSGEPMSPVAKDSKC